MRVYQLRFVAAVVGSARDRDLDEANFAGRPFPRKWTRRQLILAGRSSSKLDFYRLGADALACSERVRLECGQLEDEGEFLPVRINGLTGRFYLYNITHCPSHLDPGKTIWNPDIPKGQPGCIRSPAFHADRFGEDCVFKIPEDGASAIYCLERRDVPGHEGLKTLVKRHRLTGLRFKLVWSDGK